MSYRLGYLRRPRIVLSNDQYTGWRYWVWHVRNHPWVMDPIAFQPLTQSQQSRRGLPLSAYWLMAAEILNHLSPP